MNNIYSEALNNQVLTSIAVAMLEKAIHLVVYRLRLWETVRLSGCSQNLHFFTFFSNIQRSEQLPVGYMRNIKPFCFLYMKIG